ncbi:velvet factor-domain-containing protein [Cryomyces antarcticus]
MSRPPPPVHPRTIEGSPTDMTETQRPPIFPPPSFLGRPSPRLLQSQRLPLPSLSIAPSPVRPSPPFVSPVTQHLPAIHEASPRSHPAHAASAVSSIPVQTLLSNHDYTPRRSDPARQSEYGPTLSPQSDLSGRPLYQRPVARLHLDELRANYPDHVFATPRSAPTQQPLPSLQSPPLTVPDPLRAINQAPHAPLSGLVELAAADPRIEADPMHYRPPVEQAPLHYELRIRQQPLAARACGFGERDRRVVDPPPIIELSVTDRKTGETDAEELRYALSVVHCSLWTADGEEEETALVQSDRRTTRRLMGQLVASPAVLKDENDREGCFFCFPDLSCRTPGDFRLRFVLMRIDPMNLQAGGYSPIITEVLSDVFTVYTAKDFPGMRPSSALTIALKSQGCNIQVKKGKERTVARSRGHASDDDEEEEEDDEDENAAPEKGTGRRKKKRQRPA